MTLSCTSVELRKIQPRALGSATAGGSVVRPAYAGLCRDSVRERRRRNGADRSPRAGARPVALLKDRAACEIEVLGADDDRAWPAGCEPIHRSGSEVRDAMHARTPASRRMAHTKTASNSEGNNFDHREIAHPRKCRGKSVPSVVRMSGAPRRHEPALSDGASSTDINAHTIVRSSGVFRSRISAGCGDISAPEPGSPPIRRATDPG